MRGVSSTAVCPSHAVQLAVHSVKMHMRSTDVHLLAARLICCQDAGKCSSLCGALAPRHAMVPVRVVLLRLLRETLAASRYERWHSRHVGWNGFVAGTH